MGFAIPILRRLSSLPALSCLPILTATLISDYLITKNEAKHLREVLSYLDGVDGS